MSNETVLICTFPKGGLLDETVAKLYLYRDSN
jgi:hypothetical protein